MSSATAPLARFAVLLLIITAATGCGRRREPVEEVRPTASVVTTSSANLTPADTDWPWWRRTKGDGKAIGSAPTTWSPEKNIAWSVPVPGKGHASPIVWQDQIFLATADDQAQTQSLLCFNRLDGKLQWTCQLHQGGFMHSHEKNTQASPTPACDGQKLYWTAMVNGGLWVSAVDLQGNIVWQTEAGPFSSKHGYGSSPALYKNLVIVAGDSQGPGFLAAASIPKPARSPGTVQRGEDASFGTPVLAEVAGKTQLLLGGQHSVTSYDPATGTKFWQSAGPAEVTANTVAWNDSSSSRAAAIPSRRSWRFARTIAAKWFGTSTSGFMCHRYSSLASTCWRQERRHCPLSRNRNRQAALEQATRRRHHFVPSAGGRQCLRHQRTRENVCLQTGTEIRAGCRERPRRALLRHPHHLRRRDLSADVRQAVLHSGAAVAAGVGK